MNRVTFSQRSARGFSLYELLIALAIGSGVTTTGVGLASVVNDAAQSAEVNAFVAYLNMARSEAIKQGHRTVLCPSTNGRDCDQSKDSSGWHQGTLLFVDTDGDGDLGANDTVLRVHTAADGVRIKSSRESARVIFHPNGMTPGSDRTFTFCDARGTSKARYVVLANSGRARVSATPPNGGVATDSKRCA